MATTENATVPTPDLGLLLSHAAHAVTTELTAGLERLDISARGQCVLARASAGELTQTQLAEQCDLDKTTMVVTVDELEAKGLAERRPSPTDRRARLIVVTPAGRKMVKAAERVVEDVYDDVLGDLPADERAVLVTALSRLVEGRLASVTACERPPRRRGARGG
jgi:DNA-binding MarR family transcriptional regulator